MEIAFPELHTNLHTTNCYNYIHCYILFYTLITYIVIQCYIHCTCIHNYMYHVHDMPAPANQDDKQTKRTIPIFSRVIFYICVLTPEPNCTTSHYCIVHYGTRLTNFLDAKNWPAGAYMRRFFTVKN